ncbi:hypothetical protein SAMN04487770_102157 [Butyrivibrio sp. ob235]|uniref:hypothetical protein n=1 Tax=Butyrivibrio sp. ob235 TaxID=1761780 RepID=UPI0008D74D4F|nr:hypothetical protein [Butyrivibrio sp. ob235]SEK64355.1 hypothetical protein SAMN04487770_102157 [Butyrivibrio sp. ob235]
MKKEKLLKNIGGVLLALTVAVSPISAFNTGNIIVAEAAGGSTFDTTVELPANMEWTGWNEIGVASQDFYKVTLPSDGIFKIGLMLKNTSHIGLDVFNSSDTSYRVMTTGQMNVDDSAWTGTDSKALSAGTYYIRVSSESPRNRSQKQSYRLKTVFESYGVSENGKDSYDNPKEYTLNTSVTDSFTATDAEDWYKVNITQEGKYHYTAVAESEVVSGYNYADATLYNQDLFEKQHLGKACSGSPASSDIYLAPGTYYLKIEGNQVKYTFSLNNAKIENGKVTKVKSPGKKKAEITIKDVTGVNGYEIQFSTNKNFSKNVKTKSFEIAKTQIAGNNKRKIKINKLKRHKKYYFRVRTYIEHNNVKYYSDWSDAKSVKIK